MTRAARNEAFERLGQPMNCCPECGAALNEQVDAMRAHYGEDAAQHLLALMVKDFMRVRNTDGANGIVGGMRCAECVTGLPMGTPTTSISTSTIV